MTRPNPTPKPDLEIIIVTYNSVFWLEKTLQSLRKYVLRKTRHTIVVTVVDNASQDETQARLRSYRWVERIVLPENRGFAAANNVALAHARARNYLLLNSDVESTSETNLDTLIEYIDAHPEVGIVTPKITFQTGQLDPACHRGEPTLWNSLCYFSGLERLFPDSRLFGGYHQGFLDLDTIHPVPACSGAALLISQKCIGAIGLLDEQFFMYAEDLDWCKRCREAGYLVIFHPEVKCIHHKYKSGIKSSSQALARKTRRHFYDTMLQYYDKHYAHTYPRIVRKLVQLSIFIKKGAL